MPRRLRITRGLGRLAFAIVVLMLGPALQAAQPPLERPSPTDSETESVQPVFDLVFRGGRIVDGTGTPWYVADLAIQDGKIVRIGSIPAGAGRQEFDASGLVVAPGFVDMMGQTATPLLDDPQAAANLLSQGITTLNAGEGYSAAPLSAEEGERSGWQTMAEYLQLLDMRGLPLNVVQSVGHTQVRQLVLGDVDRRPSPAELEQMRALVREAMEAGAIGLSTALIYPPAVYARTEELIELSRVVGEYGGGYYTHLRNEGDQLIEAVDEALEIGRAAGTRVHVFHLKAAGRSNWGKMPLAIAKILAARSAGQDVTADVYPYINNGLGITALIHPRHFSAGREQFLATLSDEVKAEIRTEMETTSGWENWYRHVGKRWDRIIVGQANHPAYHEHLGLSLQAIAEACDEDPWDTFFRLVETGAFVLPESMSEANKIRAIQQEFMSFCTDAGPDSGSAIGSHPRGYGAFPRLFDRYVRQLGVLSLEQAVARASAGACNQVMVYDRGRLAEGLAADVIVFDPETFQEQASFADPRKLATGMRYVAVNGQLVWQDGSLTALRPGRVLRGPGYRMEKRPVAKSTGRLPQEFQPFDDMMQEVFAQHHVIGAALAVTDQGRLVLARGYGYADLASGEPVTPDHRFRIASISKPITAAAVWQLIQDQRLDWDAPVFAILELDDAIRSQSDRDQRLLDVTVRHLLEHRGGWDRDASFDPMFASVRFSREQGVEPPADPQTVIQAMLDQPLDFDPGERYAYSNFGYCLLGRVIEQVTGMDYEAFVRQAVLSPLQMDSVALGRTRWAGRLEREVKYYHPLQGTSVFAEDLGETVPAPYGAWYLEAMDAHGGWVASAIDLARFACAMNETERSGWLTDETRAAMHQRPEGEAGYDASGEPKAVFYSSGWLNRDLGTGRFNQWHTGSLPGTATLLIRRHDGKNFVVLFNSRMSPTTEHLTRSVDPLLHQAANRVSHWPEIDLFNEEDATRVGGD